MTRTVQPCGTPAAYKRHLAHGEPACEPCNAARRHADNTRKRRNRPPRHVYPLAALVEDITFLLSCGEGEHAILKATGYAGRAGTLRDRLNRYGHQELANQVFNVWELAA